MGAIINANLNGNFGTVVMPNISGSSELTISNTGDETLYIPNILTAAPFELRLKDTPPYAVSYSDVYVGRNFQNGLSYYVQPDGSISDNNSTGIYEIGVGNAGGGLDIKDLTPS